MDLGIYTNTWKLFMSELLIFVISSDKQPSACLYMYIKNPF